MKKILLFVLTISNAIALNAQIPTNDLSFNRKDTIPSGRGANERIFACAKQNDGKILVGGFFTEFNTVPAGRITRINQDCTIDQDFNTGTGADDGTVMTLKLQQDGKILIGGTFTSYNGQSLSGIVRLNADGSLDNTFTIGLGFSSNQNISHVYTIDIQNDGKIIVGGSFDSYNGNPANGLIRLNDNGSVDNSFVTGINSLAVVNKVIIQPDNKILVAGSFNQFGAIIQNNITRLNSDGTLDNSFTIGTGFNSNITTMELQPDGMILVSGEFTQYNGVTKNKIARINSNGILDNSFLANGTSTIYALSTLPDGKILVGGDFQGFNSQSYHNLVRIQPNGSLDPLFAPEEYPGIVYTILPLDTSSYLIAGDFSIFNGEEALNIVKLDTNGSLKNDFNVRNGASGTVHCVKIQSDGKIIASGSFKHYNNILVNGIVRLLPDGEIDTSFHTGIGFPDAYVNNILVQSDGKILLTGNFFTYNSTPCESIIRLNTDGSIDPSFNPPYISGLILTIALQSNGKILIGGTFSSLNGITANRIARLNVDGTVDVSFDASVAASDNVKSIVVQNDGKILVGGTFFFYNGNIVRYIVRINPNGSTDNTFVCGGADSWIDKIIIRPDTKIFVAGAFSHFDGLPRNGITLINEDGSTNTSYNFGNGVNNGINSLLLDGNGNLILGGYFTTYNNINCGYIAKLNSNGSINQIFNSTPNANSIVNTLEIDSSGNILVGGEFTTYNSKVRSRINRIVFCNTSYDTTSISTCGPFLWTANNQTYYTSGLFTDTINSYQGCDSIVTLDLTLNNPSIANIFVLPSDDNLCTGIASISVNGTPDHQISIDGGSSVTIQSNLLLLENQCPGIHSLSVTNNCSDTSVTQFVIPNDSNFVFNNPFIDSIAVDSLGQTIENCNIYYNTIDTAYIDSLWTNGNTIHVIWNIVDSNGSDFDTTSYVLNNGNGVYWLQISIYCPTRSENDYFTVTQAIYLGDNGAQIVGVKDLYTTEYYPVSLFPNPTDGLFYIHFFNKPATVTIEIKTIQGQNILSKKIDSDEPISLENLMNGTYFVIINSDGNKQIGKICKQ